MYTIDNFIAEYGEINVKKIFGTSLLTLKAPALL